jgi:hypothetical protein
MKEAQLDPFAHDPLVPMVYSFNTRPHLSISWPQFPQVYPPQSVCFKVLGILILASASPQLGQFTLLRTLVGCFNFHLSTGVMFNPQRPVFLLVLRMIFRPPQINMDTRHISKKIFRKSYVTIGTHNDCYHVQDQTL